MAGPLPPSPAPARGARLDSIRRRVLGHPVTRRMLAVAHAYDRGGGAMLAAALAYFALFTMVPALLLLVGLLGVLVEDADLRQQLIASLVDGLDPVSEVATAVVDGLAGDGRVGTVIGVLGLLWGASGFYGALQGAMARMFPGPGGRDPVRTRLRGLFMVVLILGSMLAAIVVIVALPAVSTWLAARCADVGALDLPLLGQACAVDLAPLSAGAAMVIAMVIAGTAALLVYTLIPLDGPSVRQALPPAVAAGTVIGLFTSLFGWLAPLLLRQWLALGVVGSVFLALVWFDLVFQALLYGAAFASLRHDEGRQAGAATSQGRQAG